MLEQEALIPERAQSALHRAYEEALSKGGKVLVAKDGELVEVSADGSQRVLKSLTPPTRVVVGSKRSRRPTRT